MPDSDGTTRRDDIQGLRAIAVLSVIAFHATLPVPGGFVGVDVFFVISGFVITAMLQREWLRTGSVHLGNFYLRRFKRLTPALAVVVVFCLIAASLLLSPFDRQPVVTDTAVGAMLFVANAVIASVSGGYFATPAEGNPLLHTWSLSVEEQFYVVFPALLLFASHIGRRVKRQRLLAFASVAALGLGSLVLLRGASIGIPSDSWLLGFYSPLNRAWEFAAGAGLALGAAWLPWLRRPSVGLVLGAVGTALMMLSFWVINDMTPFPGKATLLPVTGTTLLIAAGFSDNAVSRVLSRRPLVRIGDLSYSLYLWHWPFIVFALTIWPLSAHTAVLAAVASAVPAVISYRWVEHPVRSMHLHSRRRLLTASLTFILVPVLVGVGAKVAASQVWIPAMEDGPLTVAYPTDDDQKRLAALPDAPGYTCESSEIDLAVAGNGLCRQSRAEAPVEVALLGDSHAEHLFMGFVEEFPDATVGVYSVRGPYLMGSPDRLTVVLDQLTRMPALRTVVISRFWSSDTSGQMEASLQPAVQRLTEAGLDVLLADDVPDYPFDVFSCAYRRTPISGGELCTQPTARFDDVYARYSPMLNATVSRYPGARLLETARYFCGPDRCSMVQGGRVLYGDRDHLNADGGRWLIGQLRQADPAFTAAVLGD